VLHDGVGSDVAAGARRDHGGYALTPLRIWRPDHGALCRRFGRSQPIQAPQSTLRRFDVRFLGITHLGHAMRCAGRVVEKLEYAGERCLRIDVQSANQFGQTKIIGEALVALP
jgi:hypothetical protein